MRNGLRKAGVFLVFLALIFSVNARLAPIEAAAAEGTAWAKLGRGVSNILLGPFEIPRQIGLLSQNNTWPVAIGGGIPKGAAHTVVRMVAGAYETLTFPIEVPAGYKPIIDPEHPFPSY